MGLAYETPEKPNHADTILYEIYMLRFAAQRLLEHHQQEDWSDPKDAWVYLEAFLLHYRNLIEFLAESTEQRRERKAEKPVPGGAEQESEKPKKYPTLNIKTIWELLKVPEPGEASQIQKEGEELHAKYEQGDDKISRYVSHATTKRTDTKSWRIDEMSQQIEPLLKAIEAALQPLKTPGLWLKPLPSTLFLGPHEASTTTSTNTSPRDACPPENQGFDPDF